MSQNNHHNKPYHKVLIIGGGISGLSTAYYLQAAIKQNNLPVQLTLIDDGERLGGKIITDQVGEFIVEGGPDCFIRQKPYAAELAHDLGIDDQLIGTNDYQRKVFVLDKGKLIALPDGVMLIIPTRIKPFLFSPLISWSGKIRMGLDWFIPRRGDTSDESIGDFVCRRLGKEALEKIAEPLLSGIHVSNPETQSLLATFPRFRAIEDKYGSLIRGILAEKKLADKKKNGPNKGGSIFLSFKQGIGSLVQTLERSLACHIIKGTRVCSIERCPSGGYDIILNNGETFTAEAIIISTPAYSAADLLHSIAPMTAGLLDSIDYVSTATISLGFKKEDISQPFMGFGFIVPRKEKRDITACTWTSFKFSNRAPDDCILLRCFFGGPGREDVVDLSDFELTQLARKELEALLKLKAEPVISRIYRWRKANPQYKVGHKDKVMEIFTTCSQETRGIFLTGSAYEGVGIPDCIHHGKNTAKLVCQYFDKELVK